MNKNKLFEIIISIKLEFYNYFYIIGYYVISCCGIIRLALVLKGEGREENVVDSLLFVNKKLTTKAHIIVF